MKPAGGVTKKDDEEAAASAAAAVDLSPLSFVLAELKLALIYVGTKWALVQNSDFDLTLENEPYHAIQVRASKSRWAFTVANSEPSYPALRVAVFGNSGSYSLTTATVTLQGCAVSRYRFGCAWIG